MKRRPPPVPKPTSVTELRGGQMRKRSQEALEHLRKAQRHEMLAEISEGLEDSHTRLSGAP